MRAEQPADVYVLMTVYVDSTFEEPMVLAVPNNGVEKKKYGLLYSSPQRVIQKKTWIPRWFSPRDIPGGRPDLLVWTQFHVDERGNVQDFRLDRLNGAGPRVMQALEKDARKELFVPGYHEGRPVAMLYVEPIFDWM